MTQTAMALTLQFEKIDETGARALVANQVERNMAG